MSAALELYAQLTEAPDEKTRARLIADAFDALEARFPRISDLATQGHVRESELSNPGTVQSGDSNLILPHPGHPHPPSHMSWQSYGPEVLYFYTPYNIRNGEYRGAISAAH